MILRTNYINPIGNWLGKEKIIVLKGARQVGKTTLMKYFEKKIISDNKKTVFIYADDMDSTFLKSPSDLIEYLNIHHNFENLEEKLYIFIDEFQYIENAGLFLKNIFDKYKDKLQLIVSGSSSLEITKNTEFLTGRIISFYIDRLSFADLFFYKHNIKKEFSLKEFDKIQVFYDIMKKDLESTFLSFLNYGGYPEGIITKNTIDKEKLISEIIKTYIEKDISYFLKIENIKAFNNLIKLLSSNIGELLNINDISNTLNISMQTVNKYLDILEGTFIFTRVNPFFTNVRKELSKMPKIFIEDLAIKNYSLGEFNSVYKKIDIGRDVENFIYNEIRKKIEKEKIYFYRTVSKSEIDFVLEKNYGLYDILEVKYRNKATKPLAFTNFSKNYRVNNSIVITKDILKYENNVYFIPACIFPFINIQEK